ncbi:hypothetical protein, partial [Streptococcus suis]|uniref:hypothetical protein n=1 Tax=Streptococcus suis TaxID=1307 RepID=UPI0037043E44
EAYSRKKLWVLNPTTLSVTSLLLKFCNWVADCLVNIPEPIPKSGDEKNSPIDASHSTYRVCIDESIFAVKLQKISLYL